MASRVHLRILIPKIVHADLIRNSRPVQTGPTFQTYLPACHRRQSAICFIVQQHRPIGGVYNRGALSRGCLYLYRVLAGAVVVMTVMVTMSVTPPALLMVMTVAMVTLAAVVVRLGHWRVLVVGHAVMVVR